MLAASLGAQAGRPLTTEDATLLEEKRCQVEAWLDRSDAGTQAWLVPACNFGAGIEWQVGGARTREDGADRFSDAFVQAKMLLRPPDESAWGLGVVAGVARQPLAERHRGFDIPYIVVPLSFAVDDGFVHVDAGWRRDREARRDTATWGIAGEIAAGERLTLVAEAFGEDKRRPFVRVGGRWSVIKDVLELDLTAVTRPGGTRDERFVSLGVFWQSGRFLP